MTFTHVDFAFLFFKNKMMQSKVIETFRDIFRLFLFILITLTTQRGHFYGLSQVSSVSDFSKFKEKMIAIFLICHSMRECYTYQLKQIKQAEI